MVTSIFTAPTDLVCIHTCQDGARIGKHLLHEDYVCEYADGTLSNAFGRHVAMTMIARDHLTRLKIPLPTRNPDLLCNIPLPTRLTHGK